MKYPFRIAVLAALVTCGAPVSPAEPSGWIGGAAGSTLSFSAWYGGEELTGKFTRFEVHLKVNATDGQPEELTVQVELGSADMNDAEINAELGGPDWFDTAAFPVAEFASRMITRRESSYVASGTLRLKGAEQPLDITFDLVRNGDSAVLAGSIALSRSSWGIGSGEWAGDSRLADRVELRYRVRLSPAG